MSDTKRLTVLIIVALWCLCSLPFANAQQCGEDQLAANTIVIKKKAVAAAAGEAALTCAGGDFTTGAVEYFEKTTDGQYCTDDWTESGTQWVTNSTDQHRESNGTRSAKGSMTADGALLATLDAQDNDGGKVTFSLYVGGVDEYNEVMFFQAMDAGTDNILYLMIHNDTDSNQYRFYLQAGASGSNPLVTPDSDIPGWFDIEIFINPDGGTCKLRVYDVTDAEYLTYSASPIVTVTGQNRGEVMYLSFEAGDAGSAAFYLDQVSWAGSASDL